MALMSDYQPAATTNPLNEKVLEVFAESVVCDYLWVVCLWRLKWHNFRVFVKSSRIDLTQGHGRRDA